MRLSTSRAYSHLGVLWFAIGAAVCTLALSLPRATHIDFVAFYCAGEAVAHHANPYLQMPLFGCEHRVTAEGGYAYLTTIPAPLPPYALLPFVLLSELPFVPAYVVFTCLSLAALGVGGILLARMTNASALLLVATAAALAWDNVMKGQPVPFVFLAIVAVAWGLRSGGARLAAAAGAGTMLEPHVGLAVCAALFFYVPRTRRTLILSASLLGVLSLAVVPWTTARDYLTHVLPLHAASEAAWVTQLSLTSVLVLFGVPQQLSLTLAMIQYMITTASGVLVAAIASKRLKAPEALALIPPLFAVLGGTYVHYNLLLVAIPALILAIRRMQTVRAHSALAGTFLPWMALSDFVPFILAATSTYTLARISRSRPLVAAVCTATIAAVAVIYNQARPVLKPNPVVARTPEYAYSEESWAAYVRHNNPPTRGQWTVFLMKVPSWGGLLIVSGFYILVAYPKLARFTIGKVWGPYGQVGKSPSELPAGMRDS